MKNIIALSLLFGIFSCSTPANINTKVSNISVENNQYVARLSNQDGAKFSVKIDFNTGLNTKASINGNAAKQPSDIAKVDVYLLKLPAGFNGTDPIGPANVNVVSSFTDVAKTGSTITMTFKNVPGLASPNQYWIGVLAKDSAGNIINKVPSTAWTGATAASAPALALSTGGIGVNATTLAVSSTSDISVNVPLLDAIGATIGTAASVSAGSNSLPTITIQ